MPALETIVSGLIAAISYLVSRLAYTGHRILRDSQGKNCLRTP